MSTPSQEYIRQIPAIAALLEDANHVDVKTVEGDVTMREFIARALAYQPGWVTFLYRVRAVFVRLLGMKQEGLPAPLQMRPEDVPMTPGEAASFFTVKLAEEDRYWVAEVVESHLAAALGIVVELLEGETRSFHVVTVVHYRSWAGPVYFNVIRPLHHLVVRRMAQAGIKG